MLKKLLEDHQLYHSDFQMDHLITIRAGGTIYGQYKQALREFYKRYRGLKELYAERELTQVDIDELTVKDDKDEFQQRRNKINLAKKRMALEEIEKNISDTEREFGRFYAQAVTLKSQIGELTPERRDKLDREMWVFKLKEMAALDLATTGHLSQSTYELIGSVSSEVRIPVLKDCNPENRMAFLEWFETKHDNISFANPEFNQSIQKLLEKEG